MKTMIRIAFNGRSIEGGHQAILEPAGCGPDVVKIQDMDFLKQTFVDLTLEESDPRVAVVFRLLAEKGYTGNPVDGRYDVYTEDELQAARLLILVADVNSYVFGGQGFRETEYDMSNACGTCGTGVRQTSALLVEAAGVSKFKKFLVASTCYGDFFVKDKMVKRLEKAGVTGFTLQDVYSRRKNGETITLPRKQIVANHILPPMHRSSTLERKDVCPMCQRGGFKSLSEPPLRLVYRAKDVADIADINVTWEWFGDTKRTVPMMVGVRFSHPRMLVTPKVMNIFRDADGPDAFNWLPIRVVDE